MKRLFIACLAMLLVLSMLLVSCGAPDAGDGGNGSDGNNENNDNNDNNETPDENKDPDGEAAPKNVVEGPFVYASVYSNGLAFVATKKEPSTAYCINKKGEIQFKIENFDKGSSYARGLLESFAFQGKYSLANGALYDATGKKTTAEDLGVTAILDIVANQYIVAEKVTESYDSTKKELGILGEDLKWLEPLSEELHALYTADRDILDALEEDPIFEEAKHAESGYLYTRDGFYYANGTVVTAEEVGAEDFIGVYEGQYILASARMSDGYFSYMGLGVMNMDFEWILEPHEDYYGAYEMQEKCWISGGYLCGTADGVTQYLNLSTKEITTQKPDGVSDFSGGYADVSMLPNYKSATGWVDGKAAVMMYNSEANSYYLGIVNRQYEFLFEPVKVMSGEGNMLAYPSFYFDGAYVVISNGLSLTAVEVYNAKGEKLGALDADTVPHSGSLSIDYNDGVIVLQDLYGQMAGQSTCYYYNVKLEKLF